METKELKIVAPKGYEIDKENSTFERIVFKKIDNKPRTWEEFCERGFTGKEGYIVNTGAKKTSCYKGELRRSSNVGYVDNVEEAEAFVALMQLRQLRKAWVGDWEPKYQNNNFVWHVYANVYSNGVSNFVCTKSIFSRPMSFPTQEIAEDFAKCFKDLLEKARILL